MNREEAEQALGIIRQVVQSTKEDLVARNWGLIWIVHAFTNLAAFASVGFLVESQALSIVWYLVPLAIVAVVDLSIVILLARRETGVRSFIEWQLHGMWTTFIVFSVAAAGLIYLMQAPPRLFCSLMAMNSGIGFAMMGLIFYRRFFIFSALFLVVMVVAPALPQIQWLILGLVWWSAMFLPGLAMHRERQVRMQRGPEAQLL